MRLKDKVAIVTGAGNGIGEAIALRFAEEGARLIINDVNESTAQATVGQVKSHGASAVALAGDISVQSTGQLLASKAIEVYGRLDIVINNAADFTQMNTEDATVENWQRVLNVNVIGTALISKYAIPHLKTQGGAIVNIASMSGIIAQPNFTTYSATKAAQIMMTRSMAIDLAPWNVRVNAVAPGCVLTTASLREVERLGVSFEKWRDQWAPLHMLNRLGQPREVANAVLFLASDEASFITGTTLMVDGGYTAK